MKICEDHNTQHATSDYCPICSYALENELLKQTIKELNIKLLKAMESNQAAPLAVEIPQYKCHKVVRAFKVGKIEGLKIFSIDEKYSVDVAPDFMTKNPLNTDGYLVIYEDGYKSWSPAKAFEEGYTKI